MVIETSSSIAPAAFSAIIGQHMERGAARSMESLGREGRAFVLDLATSFSADAWTTRASRLRSDPAIHRVYPTFVHPPFSERITLNDEIVVCLRDGATSEALPRQADRFALRLVERDRRDPRIAVLNVEPPEPFAALDAANALFRSGAVAWAEPNFVVEVRRAFIPNDPFFPWQWHLNNTGQSGGRPDADIDAPEAWDLTLGSPNITIAIVDDGMNIDHPDLRANVFVNPGEIPGNGIDDDHNGYVDDVKGWDFYGSGPPNYIADNNPRPDGPADNHSTPCAGMAAAVGNNGEGVAGVAPHCKTLPCRMLGASPQVPVSRIAEAIRYAATLADVISMSWELSLPNDVVGSSIQYAVTSGRHGLGCVLVAATGNESQTNWIGFPASHPDVLAIGASTIMDVRAGYSNYTTGYGVFLLAPSSDVNWVKPVYTLSASGGYDWFAGTSAATPEAAGVAALVLSVNPNLTHTQVAAALGDSADKIDPAGAQYDASGYSNAYGYGRVNAYRAAVEVTPDLAASSFDFQPQTVPPSGTLTFSGSVRNLGHGASSPCWLEFWLSNNTTFQTLDGLVCNSVLLPSIPPGGEFRFEPVAGQLLGGVGDGLYRLGIVIDRPNQLVELSKSNNRLYRADRFLQVGAGSTNVDLRVEGFDFPPPSVSGGDRIWLRGRVVNRGAQMSRGVWTEFWASSHPVGGTLDHQVCAPALIGPLGPGEAFDLATLNRTVFGPSQGLPKGRYRFGVVVDRAGAQIETNKSNNTVFRLDKWLNVGGVANVRAWGLYR